MQGKPPPGQTPPKTSQASPAGQGPQAAGGPPGATGPAAPGGLQGIRPPEGADAKPRGRGGAGAKLSDVGWGKIFKLGWKLLSFFKFLALAYCLMMLVQNCVNLGVSQLFGELTRALQGISQPAPRDSATRDSDPATTSVDSNAAVP